MDDPDMDEKVPNPEIGMEFKTEKDAYDFYNSFGRKVGFSIRKHSVKKDKKTGVLKMRDFVCSKEGIKPKATYDFMTKQAGGRQNVGYNLVDYKNYLRTKRVKAMKKFDNEGLLIFFKRKQAEDPMFFYCIQFDVQDCITNIFWADGRMILDYERFGDVICFDTTYKTNEYGRPFAPFIGVNHHRQTVIFGAALLYDETIDSFKWLFRTFCDAMCKKEPQTILTDQDKAMSNAIKIELPGTVHRICVWHMFQNACKHLSHLFCSSKSFGNDFSRCVYDFDEEHEFLEAWERMIMKYNLTDNIWLQQLFNEKEKWALVYGKNSFCADMKSTQRCESLNKDLKKYLHPGQNIIRFFEHFERLVDDRRNAELEANFKMTQSSPIVTFPVSILKHAASVYTPTIFKLFQAEFGDSLDQIVEQVDESGTVRKYQVLNRRNQSLHIVTVDSMDESITCSCRKFEFMGILCSHALKATNHTLTNIPAKYILKRWTREAASISFSSLSSGSDSIDKSKKSQSRRYNSLLCNFMKLATMGCESEEAFECASKHLEWMLQDLKKILKAKENEKEPSSYVESLSNEKGIQAYRVKFEDGDVQQRSEIIKIKKEAHEKAMESYYIKRKSAEIIEVREKAHEIKRKENCRGRRRIKNSLERGKSKRCRQKEQIDTPNPVHLSQQPTLVRSNVQSPFAQVTF
ncbi:protein FAR1-RELATED SEQUENCE 5-like [Magnolia sinica]|uniref:protein FAR1-RELATED SEQUENCE 5-like n=1 Tax=Magnolia sinica TaxID=86752 RepID=UPI002658E286|nr:protein FAR1-RELATED SEQUENCE 5-like [Magnolia sinica]